MSKLGDICELEKYIFDPYFSDRFVSAAASGLAGIIRTPNESRIKKMTDREVIVSSLDYFEINKEEMQDDLMERLSTKIDESKVCRFINTMTSKWVDGYRSRNQSDEIWEIKTSIRNYLRSRCETKKFTIKDECKAIAPLFSVDEFIHLLVTTQEMFDHYLAEYLESRDDYLESSTNFIYIHRGLHLNDLIPDGDYFEYDYINSYSLSQSVPEQFSSIGSDGVKALVGGRVYDFYQQILAFSPFIPGMSIDQMELCVIPGIRPQSVKYNGYHSGIHEYTLENQS